MGSIGSSKERKVAATCLVAFAFLVFGMVLLEMIMIASLGGRPFTLEADFAQKADLTFIMPYFLAYLVIGGLGLVGIVGLTNVYGSSSNRKMGAEVVKLAALGYFVINYWLWSAMWLVQHKITLLAEIPTNPPEWVLRAFNASDAFWSLAGWGGLGPSIVMFLGLAWLLARGARLLPKAAAIAFLVLGVTQILLLIYVGLYGFGIQNTTGGYAQFFDMIMTLGRIVAFMLAGAALYTEKGIFARSDRHRTRVGHG